MKPRIHDAEHYSKAVDAQSDKSQPKETGAGSKRNESGTTLKLVDRANRLQQLAEKSKANDGKLKIDREELLKLRKQIADQTDSLAPTSGSRIETPGLGLVRCAGISYAAT